MLIGFFFFIIILFNPSTTFLPEIWLRPITDKRDFFFFFVVFRNSFSVRRDGLLFFFFSPIIFVVLVRDNDGKPVGGGGWYLSTRYNFDTVEPHSRAVLSELKKKNPKNTSEIRRRIILRWAFSVRIGTGTGATANALYAVARALLAETRRTDRWIDGRIDCGVRYSRGGTGNARAYGPRSPGARRDSRASDTTSYRAYQSQLVGVTKSRLSAGSTQYRARKRKIYKYIICVYEKKKKKNYENE